MIKETQEMAFEMFVKDMRKILLAKGDDYAGNVDRLSNFKLAGNICKIGPKMNCLSLIATKVARLGQLLSSESEPNNESVNDSLLDLANYTVLLYMIQNEKELIVDYVTR